MDLAAGFQIEEPQVFVPWGLTESELRSRLPRAQRVTDGYFVAECTSLGGLNHQLGFHFEPRVQGRLVELEFFRRSHPDLRQSYDGFQAHLEATFGRPTDTAQGSWDDAMPVHHWFQSGASITHLVIDRLGPEEHVRIKVSMSPPT